MLDITIEAVFAWRGYLETWAENRKHSRRGRVQLLGNDSVWEQDRRSRVETGNRVLHSVERYTDLITSVHAAPRVVIVPFKRHVGCVQPSVHGGREDHPWHPTELALEDVLQCAALISRGALIHPYPCGRATLVHRTRPPSNYRELHTVQPGVAADTVRDVRRPSALARSIRWLGVEIARATPIAVARVDHVGLVVPGCCHGCSLKRYTK